MKLPRLAPLGAAAAIALASSSVEAATYEISFDNVTGAVTGTVTGLFEIPDGDGTFAATSATLTSIPAAIGYVTAPTDLLSLPEGVFENTFVVSGGALTGFTFAALFNDITAISFDTLEIMAPWSFADTIDAGDFGESGVMDDGTTLRWNVAATAAVPVPATLPLMLAGLGGFAMLRRRKS